MPKTFSNNDFKKFRRDLIYHSKGWKVSYEDLEELVNDTILTALDNFNHNKGSFESYTRVILKNKLINFTNKNKDLFLLIALDDTYDILPADEATFEDKEIIKLAKNFLNKLKVNLTNEERKLFEKIYRSLEEKNILNISEASRESDMEPAKGWDVFRKIQTKARDLYKEMTSKDEDSGFISREKGDIVFEPVLREYGVSEKIEVIPNILFQKSTFDDYGFEKFISGLNEIQLNKLLLIYNIPKIPGK